MKKPKARVLHCWHDGTSILDWIEAEKPIDEYVGSTCMLKKGHAGPHEYTPDDHIGITFAPKPRRSKP